MTPNRVTMCPEGVRFETATVGIAGVTSGAASGTVEEILARAGYKSPDDYWRFALETEMLCSKFIRLLKIHLQTPQQVADEILRGAIPLEMFIARPFREACRSGKPWLARDRTAPDSVALDDLSAYLVEPREAAEWLLKITKYSDLVPASLKDFLRPPKRTEGNSCLGKGGRPATKQNEVEIYLAANQQDRQLSATKIAQQMVTKNPTLTGQEENLRKAAASVKRKQNKGN